MPVATTAVPSWLIKPRNYFVAARTLLARLPFSVIQLAMRIAIGFVFFNSGLLKLKSFEFAVKLFEQEYRLPFIDPVLGAQLATAVEIAVPVFLFLGLGTRIATLPLLGMVVVIEILVYPQAWVEHLLWASVLVVLLTRGPGTFSLDHLIEKRLARGQA
ncbi:MAG: DoxX family protein [Devosia sp.]